MFELGGGNSIMFLNFTPNPGKMIQSERAYFSNGLKPPASLNFKKK